MTTTATTTLAVSEIFGPTVQGEGPWAGHPATFLRTGGCNLTCGWCDSAYTWDAGRFDLSAEITRLDFDDVVDALLEHGLEATRHLVITGGEPLLQSRRLMGLLGRVGLPLEMVEVETNGTRSPAVLAPAVTQFNVSPKLPGSGVSLDRAWVPAVLTEFLPLVLEGAAVLKLVISNAADLEAADHLVKHLEWPAEDIWLMPEGQTVEQLGRTTPWVTEAAIERGWRVSPRLHVYAWGDRRGV